MTVTEPAKTGWDQLRYDHRDERLSYSPYDLWKRLRAERPVLHSDAYGGFYFVSRYDDVKRVLKDWENFTAENGINIPPQNMRMLPGEADPPAHRKYRDLIRHLLARETVAEHEGWVRDLAREWFGRVEDGVPFEACSEIIEPYAKRVPLRVIGFEQSDLDQLDHWTDVLATGTRSDEEGKAASVEFFGHLQRTLEDRARREPRDDIISALAFGRIDGEPLTMDEQLGMLIEITFGGLHTTGATLCGALVWLAGHPEDVARLRQDPDLWRTATDEFVRHVTPVTHMARVTANDVELSGCPIPKGERILFGLGSANRDDARFDNPDDVVLDRWPNQHLGFGFGPHRCAGSNLGLLGVRIGLQEWLTAFSRFEVTDYYALRWNGGEGRGLINVPMVAYR